MTSQGITPSPQTTGAAPQTSAVRILQFAGATKVRAVTALVVVASSGNDPMALVSDQIPVTDSLPAASALLGVNSVSRDPATGQLRWEVDASTSYYALTASSCSPYGCSLIIEAQTSAGVVQLGSSGLALTGNGGSPLQYPVQAHLTGSKMITTPVTALHAVVNINGSVVATSDWVPVTDSVPAPTASISVNSITRDPTTGQLQYDVDASTSYYAIGATNGCSPYGCSLIIEAQTSAGVVQLGSSGLALTGNGGSPLQYPVQAHLTGSKMITTPVTALHAVVNINGSVVATSDWVPVTDSVPAPTASISVNSITRDPTTGQLQYDVDASTSYYAIGATNGCSPYGCSLIIEAQTSAGVVQLGSSGLALTGNGGSPLQYPVQAHLTGQTTTRSISAVRARTNVNGTSVATSAWTPVEDAMPTTMTTLQISSISRDSATGQLKWELSATASYYALPDGPCNTYNCNLILQARTSPTTWTNLSSQTIPTSNQGRPQTYPVSVNFKGSTTIGTIDAFRLQIRLNSDPVAYASSVYGTSENVGGGHDLDSAVSLALVAVAGMAPAEACLTLFPIGTHTNSTSLNDQEAACNVATGGGKTIAQFLKSYLATLTPQQITKMLAAAGIATAAAVTDAHPEWATIDYDAPLPSGCSWVDFRYVSCSTQSGPVGVTPRSAPSRQDPVWESNQAAKAAQNRATSGAPTPQWPTPAPDVPAPMPAPSPSDIDVSNAELCEQELTLAQASGSNIPDDACDNGAVFFGGQDTPVTTQHDKDVIALTPTLAWLTYANGTEKPDSGRRSWANQGACAGQDTSTEQCDEYPFYSTEEGYPAMNPPDLRLAPKGDNVRQGSKLAQFYKCDNFKSSPRNDVKRKFLVVPTRALTTTWLCGTP
ncbi:NucA/NucB deoxyribonuclease domain-containing protein [Leifsonia shinshuensis]|uniref:NucA/NucB deoxyribonuclease domain-containing protein n=1 Tax=Leifsonia shinshuensis TaxID=150026 RepID=UPI0031EC688C